MIDLALRYGILSTKCKNSLNNIIKKRSKKSTSNRNRPLESFDKKSLKQTINSQENYFCEIR